MNVECLAIIEVCEPSKPPYDSVKGQELGGKDVRTEDRCKNTEKAWQITPPTGIDVNNLLSRLFFATGSATFSALLLQYRKRQEVVRGLIFGLIASAV